MAVADWLFELGELKRIARSGWWSAKVRHPETVAEHSWRTACIAYALALEEGLDGNVAAVAALFHDAHEARTLDLHKVAKRYAQPDDEKASADQRADSPARTRLELEKPLAPALKAVVKDADLLEMAVTAQEYMAAGHLEAQKWRDGVKNKLKTKTAKKWYGEICRTKPSAWYAKLR